ncbi:polar amino acid transport system substrate-binding protein [Rhodococcus sp. LBL1]|uniref:Polar amino acid transport system substrate-binding protein n=1 Tax=Prescottella agglutinans TaxID=1644129 RepID=A0ABT6M814_9NOCA|nr:ABC transporter substrate-binding protein [Prescottella agglutinans]MDH6280040.1 polar amino acid transport system substrate-binding protein [Prescottella agglutinans]MDH6679552.1 polar amino acid transport system substrate-binding protein [Rhodococcus sp. LBL1]MDH6685309.1 polar amino acid transport system substrate-binding protein [Rhodococcus sp. LBL2]
MRGRTSGATRGVRARFVRAIIAVLTAVVAFGVAGCVTNNEGLVPVISGVEVNRVAAIADQLPPQVAQSGRLVVGVNTPYAPNEFKDEAGNIVGFDVDLMKAVGEVLGLTLDLKQADFDKIIPAVQAGTFNVGMSSFTDTLEREQSVDFVTYYSAGVQWAQRPDGAIDPNNACGLRVGVQTTTIEDLDDVPTKSDACVAAGKPPIDKIKYDSQDDVANALILGRVDALSADSPVTAYAIKRSGGRIEPAGPLFDSAPYGWVVPKGSPLAPVLQQAMQYLIDGGQYQRIAEAWGVEAGVIDKSVINGATS